MLQDLDKRQQGHELSNVIQPQIPYLARSNSYFNGLLFCVFSLLLGGGVVYGWQTFMATPVEATPTLTSEHNPLTSAPTDPVPVDSVVWKPTSASLDSVTTPVKVTTAARAEIGSNAQITMPVFAAEQLAIPVPETDLEPESEQESESDMSLEFVDDMPANDDHNQPDSISGVAANTAPKAQGKMAITEVTLTPQQLANKRFALASEAQKDGQLSRAIDYYEQTLALDPGMHEARKQLAALHYGQNQLAQSSDLLQQGLILYPQEVDFALLLARVQQASAQPSLALATLANVPDTHLLARQKWMAQSDIAQKLGQFTLAEQAYRQLLQQEPIQAKWWMGLAYTLDSQQQFTQARQAYRTALGHRGLSAQASAFIEQRLTQLGDSQ
ncbi:tetratricopeptide repeat protein [Shewanella glacialipiscicola]